MKEHYQLVLIDGSSYLFRAFHALPPLVTSKGFPTGAVKGVISMIRKLMLDYPDSQIACVFDASGKSFRNEIYPEYKANRAAMPDELRVQIAPIFKIIKKMGIPLLKVDGVEADDVIGTLAAQATASSMDVLISTGDKDMAQLVNENVTLINTMTNTLMDEAGVLKKFGVRPKQIIDYLALVGDASDNIPGIPNCGPKTAGKWLLEHRSLSELIKNADSIKGKAGENLRKNLDQLMLSERLATIKCDLDLDHEVGKLKLGSPDSLGLLEVFTELELRSWIEELEDTSEELDQNEKHENVVYKIILTIKQFQEWLGSLSPSSPLAVHVETTNEHYMKAHLVGLSICQAEGFAIYIPLMHEYEEADPQLPKEFILEKLKLLFSEYEIVGHNLKHATSILSRYGIEFDATFDVMLASYILNSVASKHDIDDLAFNHLGKRKRLFAEAIVDDLKKTSIDQLELSKVGNYVAEIADIIFRLYTVLQLSLEDDGNLISIMQDVEMPLLSVLSRAERNGVLLDPTLLKSQSYELQARMEELEQEAFNLAGEEFNLGSPKQLQDIFFNKLKLPVLKKTPKGQPSTAEPVLQDLALDYQLPRVILEYRGISKLKSTYTDALPKQINEQTGRVHTSYQQAVTATGRLSSTDPNLQNIPIRSKEGRRVRKAFVASEGHILVAADYSQIELRIMAHLSKDSSLVSAFNNNLDIHSATAAEVFGIDLNDVKDHERRSAKAINFGLIYGMSAFGLARQLNIPHSDAQAYIDMYFDRYPGVKVYMDKIKVLARQQGYVETIFGRRLYLPEINAGNFQRRQAAERTAINAPMQGSAADIIKKAMINIDKWIKGSGTGARIIMQVHDELVLEVKGSHEQTVMQALKNHMSSAAKLIIPLVVETGSGKNWDDAH